MRGEVDAEERLRDEAAAEIASLRDRLDAALRDDSDQSLAAELAEARRALARTSDEAARAAESERALRAELDALRRDNEKGHHTDAELDALRRDLDTQSAARKAAVAELDTVRRELEKQNTERKDAVAELDTVRSNLAKQSTARKDSVAELDTVRRDLEKQKTAHKDVVAELDTVRSNLAKQSTAHKDAVAELDAVRKASEREARVAKTDLDEAKAVADSLRSRLDEEIAKNTRRSTSSEETLSALKAAKVEIAELRQSRSPSEIEVAELRRRLAEAGSEAEVAHSIEIGEFRARLAAAVAERDTATARAARLESELRAREAASEAFEDAREAVISGLQRDLATEADRRSRVEADLAEALGRERESNEAERASVKAELAALRAELSRRDDKQEEKEIARPAKGDLDDARARMSRELETLIEEHESERLELATREQDLVAYTAELRAALDAVAGKPRLPAIPRSLLREPLQPRNGANFLGLKTLTHVIDKAANPLSQIWNHPVDDVAAKLRDAANVVMTNSNLGLAMTYLRDEGEESDENVPDETPDVASPTQNVVENPVDRAPETDEMDRAENAPGEPVVADNVENHVDPAPQPAETDHAVVAPVQTPLVVDNNVVDNVVSPVSA